MHISAAVAHKVVIVLADNQTSSSSAAVVHCLFFLSHLSLPPSSSSSFSSLSPSSAASHLQWLSSLIFQSRDQESNALIASDHQLSPSSERSPPLTVCVPRDITNAGLERPLTCPLLSFLSSSSSSSSSSSPSRRLETHQRVLSSAERASGDLKKETQRGFDLSVSSSGLYRSDEQM
ncbi:unnamed protein product [Pleuronectes platessa]|uniref:Uncharacterized protein n=1 Tax=Pleuronectes platessa TaxID=8262 RepID=A0A9N7YXR2_PLEPL|nr:unnamed protein product [Pleuronectes platessa]